MKVCVSEFTYETFEEILEKNFSNEEFILINSEGEITKGDKARKQHAMHSYARSSRTVPETSLSYRPP